MTFKKTGQASVIGKPLTSQSLVREAHKKESNSTKGGTEKAGDLPKKRPPLKVSN